MTHQILLVDAAGQNISAALQHHYQVRAVASVAEAARVHQPGAFDAVLIRLDLASVSAFRELAQLCSAVADTPVFVLAGRHDEAQVRAALRAGAAEVLAVDDVVQKRDAVLRDALEHAHAANGAQPSANIPASIVKKIQAASGAFAATIYTISDDGQTLIMAATTGYDAGLVRRFQLVPLSAAIPAAESARNGVPLFMDSETWDRMFPATRDVRLAGSRAWVALPLLEGKRVIGVLTLSYDSPQQFTESERAILLDLARQAVEEMHAQGIEPERRLADASSHEQLRTVLEATPDCIKLIDRYGIVVQMNRAGREMLEADPHEVVGYSVLKFVAPEYQERVRACLRAALQGETVDCELEIISQNGTRRPVESRLVALRDDDGNITATLAITRDMTAQRNADAALVESARDFRELVENLSDGVLLVDREATILYINQMSQTVLGYRPEEMVGRAGWLFVHPDDVADLRESLAARLQGIDSHGVSEVRMRHRDGSWRILQLRARRYDANPATGDTVIITARDVTETRRTEIDLQQTREQLVQSQKLDAIGRLAGGIAHDFNNLLTAIGGHTDLLIDGLRHGDPMQADLREIRVAVDRAAALTRQLLAFSRKQVLQTTVIDVRELVTDTRSMLGRLIGAEIDMAVLLPEEPAFVRADYTQLQQVLVNLAVNARDAMPRGGSMRIEVGIDESRDPSSVRLRVSDTGTGMDEDVKQRIFEPFFTTKEAGKGTGLGLPTVYGIVQQSGGRIEVTSEPGKGSTFDVYLPEVDASGAQRPKPVRANAPPQGRETILLVEDETAVRTVTARMLRRGGYTVVEAEHPHRAIEVIRDHEQPITMIVSDVGLPGLTGPEMVEQIMEERPDVKVLFTSGYTNDEIFAEGRIAARFAFLEKPFTSSALLATVRNVLDH